MNMDTDSFYRYCKKYNIPTKQQNLIISAFDSQKPDLVKCAPEYAWQKEGKWAYKFTCQGKRVTIELGNWPSMNNVTFVGVEGMNV